MNSDSENQPSKNPFADDPDDVREIDESNRYGAPVDTAYNPVYERTLFPRTTAIVSMTVFGFLMVVTNEIALGSLYTIFLLPLAGVSLIGVSTALWLGVNDLAAMREGVMPDERRTVIRTAVAVASFTLLFFVARTVYMIVHLGAGA